LSKSLRVTLPKNFKLVKDEGPKAMDNASLTHSYDTCYWQLLKINLHSKKAIASAREDFFSAT
jgi:hypothetical protein